MVFFFGNKFMVLLRNVRGLVLLLFYIRIWLVVVLEIIFLRV